MIKKLSIWQLVGFVATSIGGTLLHYIYDWTSESVLIAPFSGVNESTWEHMKLLYFPLVIFAIIQSFFFKEQKNFWCVKLFGTVAGLILIPLLFYTYNGAFGKSPDWVNITIFFVAVACVFLFEWWIFKTDLLKCRHPMIAIAIIGLIGVLFVVFTFYTPEIPLFQDPLTSKFGLVY